VIGGDDHVRVYGFQNRLFERFDHVFQVLSVEVPELFVRDAAPPRLGLLEVRIGAERPGREHLHQIEREIARLHLRGIRCREVRFVWLHVVYDHPLGVGLLPHADGLVRQHLREDCPLLVVPVVPPDLLEVIEVVVGETLRTVRVSGYVRRLGRLFGKLGAEIVEHPLRTRASG